MKRRFVFAIAMVLLTMAFGLFRFSAAAAQNGAPQQTAQAPEQPTGMPAMMRMHEQMMAEMKAADARLDALVTEMNAATGNAKVAAIASLVNELAAQHKAMHERMGRMHQQTMGGRGMMMNR